MKSKIVFGCCLLAIIEFAKAQPNTFFKFFNSYPNKNANSVAETSTGDFIAAIALFHSVVLLKTDSVGNFIDSNSFCNARGCYVKNTLDGNFVFVGTTNDQCSNWLGNEDYLLYKINSNLDTVWLKVFGTGNLEEAFCVRELKDGSYTIGGSTFGTDNFYKLDSAGTIMWHHWLPIDHINSIIEDSEGNFILCGYTNWFPDSWSVIKTDSTGANVLWVKYYGTNGGGLLEMFHDLIQLPDSNYLVCGFSPQSIMKINKSTGDSIWRDSLQGDIFSIDTAANGNFIIAGDSWLRLLNDTGGIVWSKSFLTSNIGFYCVRSTSDGGFILSGAYYDSLSTNIYPMLLKTDSSGNFSTGIEQLKIKTENYSLYPNPLTTQCRLEFGNAKHEHFIFTLYDITGRQIENSTSNGDHFIISKDSKQSGLYFFKLENEKTGEVENGKVVIG